MNSTMKKLPAKQVAGTLTHQVQTELVECHTAAGHATLQNIYQAKSVTSTSLGYKL